MNPAEVRRKIADIVTEVDQLIDNESDVLPKTAALLNQAANMLAKAYVTVPGRFQADE